MFVRPGFKPWPAEWQHALLSPRLLLTIKSKIKAHKVSIEPSFFATRPSVHCSDMNAESESTWQCVCLCWCSDLQSISVWSTKQNGGELQQQQKEKLQKSKKEQKISTNTQHKNNIDTCIHIYLLMQRVTVA